MVKRCHSDSGPKQNEATSPSTGITSSGMRVLSSCDKSYKRSSAAWPLSGPCSGPIKATTCVLLSGCQAALSNRLRISKGKSWRCGARMAAFFEDEGEEVGGTESSSLRRSTTPRYGMDSLGDPLSKSRSPVLLKDRLVTRVPP